MHKIPLKQSKSIYNVVKSGLCLGCGVCVDTCPKNAIQIHVKNGLNIPFVDHNNCINCGICNLSCPGRGVEINRLSKDLYSFDTTCYDNMIGYHCGIYMGYCLDGDIRFHGASGGMVTGLLVYLLEKHLIDGAVVTGFKKDNPLRPHTYIARSRTEIYEGRSSKYCAVSMDGIINQINESKGKYVIVGLPCHIQGFRKYATIHNKFAEKIFAYFAIYCSINKSYNSIDYLMRKYNQNPSKVKYFSYRDDGCMGYMKIIDSANIEKKISFDEYFISLHGFFNIKRCNLCIDHSGELADACFGDVKEDDDFEQTTGESSFIIRSKIMQEVLQMAINDNFIYAENLDKDILKERQVYMRQFKKGKGLIWALSFRRLLGKKNPCYDINLEYDYNVKGFIKEIKKIFIRFIGAHRYMWFVIDIINSVAKTKKLKV